MKEKNFSLFFMVLLYLLLFCKADECQKEKPIKYNKSCVIRFCSQEDLKTAICIISNEKVKKQWINNIMYNFNNISKQLILNEIRTENPTNFVSGLRELSELSELSDLTDLSDSSELSELNELSELLSTTIGNTINIDNKSEKYLLTCIYNSCDLLNYNNYIIQNFDVSDSSTNSISKKNPFFKLNDNNYFYGKFEDDNHLLISKINISFSEENNNNYNITKQSKYLYNFFLKNQDILSCFQTSNNFIECLIIDSNSNLTVFIFDEFLIYKHNFSIDSSVSLSKCIHLEKEIGVYNYFFVDKSINPSLKIKELKYNESNYDLIDIVNDNIKININFDNSNISLSNDIIDMDLLKISNTKFAIFYSLNKTISNEYFFLIIICDLYGNNNTNALGTIFLRYYKIPLILYNIGPTKNIIGFIYENNIGLSFINQSHPSIIIFGYNNNKDPDRIENINNINNNNNLYYIINLNDYLNNEVKIDNNLFGYEFIEIKIIKLMDISSGIKFYLNHNKNNVIRENDTVNINDKIIIDYSNINTNKNEDYYLELSPIFGESKYDIYNSYADHTETFGVENPENYFRRKIFQGNSLKIKFNFGCHNNCETCDYAGILLDNQKCLTCKNNSNFCYMNNEQNCFDINDLIYNYYNKNGILNCVPLNLLCPDDYPFEDINTKECKEMITFNELVLGQQYNFSNIKKALDKVLPLFYEEIKNKKLTASDDKIINAFNVVFHLTTQEKQNI